QARPSDDRGDVSGRRPAAAGHHDRERLRPGRLATEPRRERGDAEGTGPGGYEGVLLLRHEPGAARIALEMLRRLLAQHEERWKRWRGHRWCPCAARRDAHV